MHQGASIQVLESLVRARYSAYVLNKPDFIMRTTHPDGPHYNANASTWAAQISLFCAGTAFEMLEILDTTQPETVTYRATMRQDDRRFQVMEVSYFRQLDGRWLYYDGDFSETTL
ncbi:MAG: YchJ family metal-binding protein [Chloroflexota bacterium]